ncbi:YjiH family protein, partial [Vibrio rumoiensis]
MNDSSKLAGNAKVEKTTYPVKTYLTFIIPSLIGLFLFMAPLSYQGSYTIPVAILAKSLQATISGSIIEVITMVIAFMAVITTLYKLVQPSFIKNNAFLHALLTPSLIWFVVRILGGVAAIMAFY